MTIIRPPSSSGVSDETPFPMPKEGDKGFIVTHLQRALSAREWVAVRIFRRPDPRISVFAVTVGSEKA